MRKKSSILAFLSALFFPSVSQFYLSRPRLGTAYLFLPPVVLLLHVYLGQRFHYTIAISFIVLLIVWRLFVLIEAPIAARSKELCISRWFNKWYIYVAIAIATLSLQEITRIYASKAFSDRWGYAFRIPAMSMNPTLDVGDQIIVDTSINQISEFDHGDLLVFASPIDPGMPYVKRLVGFPEDKIEIKKGILYVNDRIVSEDYVIKHIQDFGPISVPKDKFFTLGDNRPNSLDSRHFGAVDGSMIHGKPIFIYWSDDLAKIGKF